MRIKEFLSKAKGRLMEPIDVLMGQKVIDAQKTIIDTDKRIIALHEENREVMDRMLSLANKRIEALEKKVDLQGQIIRVLKTVSSYEEDSDED